MNKPDKLYRKIRRLSMEIARLSAAEDERKEWWGFDTNIGDLPMEIQKKLSKFIDWYRKNIST